MRLHKVIAIAMSLGLLMCSSDERSSGDEEEEEDDYNVGTPCVPSDEADPSFAGFRVTEETIETGAKPCGSGVCLVNHFQGRVGCPLGQPPPVSCSGPDDAVSCGPDAACVEAAPQTYVCHKPGECQTRNADDNTGKACCVPGTDAPVTTAVCGQCSPDSNRDADRAVYCSCRCGPAEGAPADDDDKFCKCGAGYACEEVRPYLGVGDPKLTGKYCIKMGSEFTSQATCGQVKGYFDQNMCKGISIGGG